MGISIDTGLWGEAEKVYETGLDYGMIYVGNDNSLTDDLKTIFAQADKGAGIIGLQSFDESPEGADANELYGDNGKYLTLRSAEEYKYSFETYTYPEEFQACIGKLGAQDDDVDFAYIGEQSHKAFMFVCRTKIGNKNGDDYGYKIHVIFNSTCDPASSTYSTENDNPDAISMQFSCDTVPETISAYEKGASDTSSMKSATFTMRCLKGWANKVDGTAEKIKYNVAQAIQLLLFGGTTDAEWTASTVYYPGDIVIGGASGSEKAYICKAKHTAPSAWAATNWVELTSEYATLNTAKTEITVTPHVPTLQFLYNAARAAVSGS